MKKTFFSLFTNIAFLLIGCQTGTQQKGEFQRTLGVKWIKAKSGNTYLCPVNALDRLKAPTEEQLKLICVDESLNPQNE